eukprot:15438875-Alexandrium_andersonii.AAC.1
MYPAAATGNGQRDVASTPPPTATRARQANGGSCGNCNLAVKQQPAAGSVQRHRSKPVAPGNTVQPRKPKGGSC